jgi:hypothetical protein
VKEKQRQMDKAARQLKRQNVEVKQKENERETMARQLKRQNVEVKQKQNERETVARNSKRKIVEVKEKERRLDKAARKIRGQNIDYMKKKQEQNTNMKRKLRENQIFLERERVKKQILRRSIHYRQRERVFNSKSKHRNRTSKCYRLTENERNRQRRFGTDMQGCIDKFHEQIKLGPVFVCSCCHQPWFKESVLRTDDTNKHFSKIMKITTNVLFILTK